jgi:hypothetical protein
VYFSDGLAATVASGLFRAGYVYLLNNVTWQVHELQSEWAIIQGNLFAGSLTLAVFAVELPYFFGNASGSHLCCISIDYRSADPA